MASPLQEISAVNADLGAKISNAQENKHYFELIESITQLLADEKAKGSDRVLTAETCKQIYEFYVKPIGEKVNPIR
jgi:hypothetical protein